MEPLHTIWLIISIFCVAFTFVFFYLFFKNLRSEVKLIENVKEFKANVKIVYVEAIGDRWYLYDKIHDHFICQAPTEKELLETANSMFPNMKILLTSKDTIIKQ
jgi:hypothetical protein